MISRREFVAMAACAAASGRGLAQPFKVATPTRYEGPDPSDLSRLQVFPADNPWNRDISALPVHANSDQYIASIGADTGLHPDFGTEYEGAPNGIPYVAVNPIQRRVAVDFVAYGDESDPGPYPVPAGAPIEGGPASTGDRHVIVVDTLNSKLYELYRAFPNPDGSWRADCGAVFDLRSNRLRPDYWTSADAAGLPIFAGLVRYDECVQRRSINHAIRFTAQRTQRAFIHPATHFASNSSDPSRPPMGLRLRLGSWVQESNFPESIRPIITAFKRFGVILADNGSNWYISGAPDPRWNDDDLHALSRIRGRDFQAVETGPLIR